MTTRLHHLREAEANLLLAENESRPASARDFSMQLAHVHAVLAGVYPAAYEKDIEHD